MDNMPLEMIFGNFTAWEAKKGTWFINFMNGSQNLYLLEGSEKALLIDTGWGVGNLRAYVEKLTDKPIIVVNTHFHPDHSCGNGEFEEVGVSASWEIDEPSLGDDEGPMIDLKSLPFPDYKKVILKEGDTIDLGNRVIEVLDAKPAHCNSSLFFIDKKENMIFAGDEFESAQTIMFDNSHNPDAPYDVRERLENMKENALRLYALCDENTWLLPNHNGFPIAKEYLLDYAGLADAIFAGTAVIEDKLNHPYIDRTPEAVKYCRVRYGKCSIFIEKAEVNSVYGK